jgi:hypothetical protein
MGRMDRIRAGFGAILEWFGVDVRAGNGFVQRIHPVHPFHPVEKISNPALWRFLIGSGMLIADRVSQINA